MSLLAAVLTGAAVAALVTAYSATLETEGGAFSVLFRFVLIPMTLFSGTFFPVDRLPVWIQPAGLGLAAVARHRAGPGGRARAAGCRSPRWVTSATCWSLLAVGDRGWPLRLSTEADL